MGKRPAVRLELVPRGEGVRLTGDVTMVEPVGGHVLLNFDGPGAVDVLIVAIEEVEDDDHERG